MILSAILFLTVTASASPQKADSPPVPREEAVNRLAANGVNVSSLTRRAGQSQPVSVGLGTGVNGALNATANDENLKLVARVPEIGTLSLYSGTFTAEGIAALAGMPNLRRLLIGSPSCDNAAFAPLAMLTGLTHLTISDYAVTDQVLGHVAGVKELESLTIMSPLGRQNPQLTAGAVASFLDQARNLKELVLLGVPIDDACIERIGRMSAFTRLWTDSRAVTPGAWGALTNLTRMTDLYLKGTTFDDSAAPALARMPDLRSLILDDTRVTDAALESLAGLVSIADLGLARTRVTDKGMVHLSELGHLHNLYLVGTAVTVDGLRMVGRKEDISMLRIGQRPLSPDEVRALRAMFGRTEIFDTAGYWSPAREEAAMRQTGKPAVDGTK
jgi:hypothetical protein